MSNSVLPGEKIAIIEEYGAGSNACDDGHVVRATVIGETETDKKERLVSVKKHKPISVPEKGDIVIGTVEAVMGSMIAVLIKYINSKPVKAQVECICATRNIRKKYVALVNDLVKLRIIGTLNGATHAAMNSPELGVLFTKCRKCGKGVKPMRDIVKCIECGWTDDRKLSSDFLKSDFVKMRE